MQTALTNVLLGMGTVFGALILISFIIALLRPISEIFLGMRKSKNNSVEPMGRVEASNNVAEVEEIDMASETELVAVITAAIMASYSENNFIPDGLVVRKIRRIKK